MRYSSTLSLTPALEWREGGSATTLSLYPRGRDQVPVVGGPRGRSGRVLKISVPIPDPNLLGFNFVGEM